MRWRWGCHPHLIYIIRMNKIKLKENYTSPMLEIIIIDVERGFQSSGNNDGGITAPGWVIN